jgi:hypothetical protein
VRTGAHAGGSFDSGHACAMVEIRVEDPGTLGDRWLVGAVVDRALAHGWSSATAPRRAWL